MAVLAGRPGATKPPPGRARLETSSPLAAGLLVAAPFNMGGGPPQDAARRYTSVFSSTPPAWEVSAAGLCVGTTGTQYVEWPDSVIGNLAGSWSVLLRLNPTSLGSYTALIDSVATPRKWGIFRATSTDIYVQHPGVATLVTTSPSLVAGAWQTLIVTYDVPTKRTTAYLDGRQVGTNTHAGAIAGYIATPIRMGTNPSTGGLAYSGKYGLFLMWDRPLLAAEAAQLGADPYVLFRAPHGHLHRAIALTLAPAAVAVPIAVAAPTLSLSLTLLPAAVAVPIATPASTLALSTTLVPDPVAIPIATQSPALSLLYALTPSSVAVPVEVPASTLSLALALAPSPVAVPIVTGAPALDRAYTIAPDVIAAPILTTAPTIGLVYDIAPSAAAVTLAAPAPTLSLLLGLTPLPVATVILVPAPEIGGAIVPGHHTVSDAALYLHTVSDSALFVHTSSDQEGLG